MAGTKQIKTALISVFHKDGLEDLLKKLNENARIGLKAKAAEKDADEFLDLVELPFQQALQQVLSGKISDGKTQTAILKAAVLLGYAK